MIVKFYLNTIRLFLPVALRYPPILDDDNQWKLSPAYDLTFSYGPNDEQSTTVMGEGRSPSIEHLRALGKKHGLKNAEPLIDQVNCAVKKWPDYADKTGLTKRSTKDIFTWFRVC